MSIHNKHVRYNRVLLYILYFIINCWTMYLYFRAKLRKRITICVLLFCNKHDIVFNFKPLSLLLDLSNRQCYKLLPAKPWSRSLLLFLVLDLSRIIQCNKMFYLNTVDHLINKYIDYNVTLSCNIFPIPLWILKWD